MSLLSSVVRRSVRLAQPLARAYTEGNMTVGVKITRAGERDFDLASGKMVTPEPTEIYVGDARMYTDSGGQVYQLGDEPQYFSNSYVSIPLSAQRPQVNDEVEITRHDDIQLIGRHYRITGVDSGGLLPVSHRCSVVGAEPAPNVDISEKAPYQL